MEALGTPRPGRGRGEGGGEEGDGAEADRAVRLGAREVADHGYVVLESPGGLVLCLVAHPASRPAAPSRWPDLSTSLLDQVCLDVPRATYDEHAAWTVLADPAGLRYCLTDRSPQ